MKLIKTILPALVFIFLSCLPVMAQENVPEQMSGQDSLETIAPLDTVKTHKVVYPEHLIGIRYSYCITNVNTNVDVNQKGYNSPLNLELLYTYYHPMWGYIGFFGLQTGIRYTSFGFTTEPTRRNFDEIVTTLQLPVFSAFHFDVGKYIRFFINLGPYVGYRLTTSKEEGWDCFDKRFEWGVEAQGGIGLRFGRVEFHLGAGYQYCFAFLFDPEKFSSDNWLYSYPTSLSIGAGLHFKLK